MEQNILELLTDELETKFEIIKPSLPEKSNYEEQLRILKKQLKERIEVLLTRDFDRFMNTLYRIDLNEEKVRFAFSPENKNSIPDVLVDLIIERQIQRIKTRRMYKSQNKNND